ncbi:hypothetical protein SDC9_184930 [bioreactor metagenome]|uniref:Uncharacterized protein n=1 Tax=bioreactor metagenome TaxID=1076179 RepID=A0A645HPW7_9ZZZZ
MHLALLVGGNGGDNRDAAGVDQVDHGLGPHLGDLSDQAEVDLLAVHLDALARGGEQASVLPRQPDGQRPVGVQQADQFAVDLAHQHHPDDVHRLGGGDPQTAAELAFDPEPVQHRGDLRPTAVDHHRIHADRAQEDDVGGKGLHELVVDHGVAAVLDHDGLADIALQPGQRFNQDGRFVERLGHDEYSAFSLT